MTQFSTNQQHAIESDRSPRIDHRFSMETQKQTLSFPLAMNVKPALDPPEKHLIREYLSKQNVRFELASIWDDHVELVHRPDTQKRSERKKQTNIKYPIIMTTDSLRTLGMIASSLTSMYIKLGSFAVAAVGEACIESPTLVRSRLSCRFNANELNHSTLSKWKCT